MEPRSKKRDGPEKRVQELLEGSSFGLATEELARKIRLRKESTQRLLDKMVHRKEIRKTKAGKSWFYSTKKIIVIFFLLVPFVNAQNMTSGNYILIATVQDAAGGNTATVSNQTLLLSLGQISGTKLSDNYDLCAGFLCSFFDELLNGKVTFILGMNINGAENDQVFVDRYTETRRYLPGELLNQYVCLQDPSQPNSPTFGIVFAGYALDYIRAAPGNSYNMRVSQEIPGNKFIIPITRGNCTSIERKMPQIMQYGALMQPFSLIPDTVNAVELALTYQAFDISGSFDKTGPFKIVVEKNETNPSQIIIKPE
jgi:hypothetical protein